MRGINNNTRTFVIVGGYHGSGASAVVDMLSEYKEFYHSNVEMRLICDPYGIKQLERALIDDWDWISSSGAIIDFLNLAHICGRSGGGRNPFARAGLNYSQRINSRFMEITEEYIDTLTEFNYYRDFYFHKFKMSYLKYVFCRIRFALEVYSHGNIKSANRKTKNYFSRPTRDDFYNATKNYFDELYEDNAARVNADYVLMDLALSPRDALRMHNYFSKAKMIVVDRDPRDILANLLQQGRYVDDWKKEGAGHRFAQWQLEMRKNLPYHPDILYLRFEDIVLEADKTRKKIGDFLGVNLDEPDFTNKYFHIDESSKNIGYWEKYYEEYKDTFDEIAEEMIDYLYHI